MASTCTFGWAGIVCAVTGTLWLLIGCCVIGMKKNPSLFDDDDVGGSPPTSQKDDQPGMIAATTGMEGTPGNVEETVTRTENGDGTVTVLTMTTTTNPDGSKTVTERTETEPAA